jgi:cell division protein FtsI/penicillin-binding protein 2
LEAQLGGRIGSMIEPERPERGSRRRLTVLWLGTIVGVLILMGRLFYWQVMRHKDLKEVGQRWQLVDVPIPALRGTIVDRHGFVLALDEYEFEIFATPRDIRTFSVFGLGCATRDGQRGGGDQEPMGHPRYWH